MHVFDAGLRVSYVSFKINKQTNQHESGDKNLRYLFWIHLVLQCSLSERVCVLLFWHTTRSRSCNGWIVQTWKDVPQIESINWNTRHQIHYLIVKLVKPHRWTSFILKICLFLFMQLNGSRCKLKISNDLVFQRNCKIKPFKLFIHRISSQFYFNISWICSMHWRVPFMYDCILD